MAQPFRFIHCGDLHLGAPFTAVPSIGAVGDRLILEATYTSFSNIVDLALKEHVDAVLISGDIYNSADHNIEAQIRFVSEMERLAARQIPVYIVHGNHDPVEAWTAKVPMPKNVHVFSGEHVERKIISVRGEEAASIYGISHKSEGIYDDLASQIAAYPDDVFAIGLLHATVGGQEGHTPYAPTSMKTLQNAGVDYWALGHIHKREVLSTEPYIVYAGNSQGLNRKEMGPKGCYLVSVNSNGYCDVAFQDTASLIFERAEIDISDLESIQDIEEMIRHTKKKMYYKYRRPVLLTIVLKGMGALAEACSDEETRKLWITKAQEEERGNTKTIVLPMALENETKIPVDLKERRRLPDVLGDYLQAYDGIAMLDSKEKVNTLRHIIEQRPEWKRLRSYAFLLDDETIEEAFAAAEQEGARHLLEEKK